MKKFKPKPGQIDFTNARWAPVINCVVKYKDKILVVKRDSSLDYYPRYWNGISGFLDDHKSLEQKAKEEIREETGISDKDIISIKLGKIFDQEDKKSKKTWVVHPLEVKVKTNKVSLNWEAEDFCWVSKSEIKKYKIMPGFLEVLRLV